MRVRYRIFATLIALLAVNDARADGSPPIPTGLRCEFESYTSAVAEKGQASIKAEVRPQPGIDPLVFAALDPSKETAQMIGNIGASNVAMLVSGTTWSFIEVTDFANVNTTQVFLWEEPAADQGIYRAIHSRHSSLMGVIVASQHYGHCKALN